MVLKLLSSRTESVILFLRKVISFTYLQQGVCWLYHFLLSQPPKCWIKGTKWDRIIYQNLWGFTIKRNTYEFVLEKLFSQQIKLIRYLFIPQALDNGKWVQLYLYYYRKEWILQILNRILQHIPELRDLSLCCDNDVTP